MNSRAQFFVMFAVIFGLLILSVAGRFNFASFTSKNLISEFQRTCKNYRHEIFMISQNYTLTNHIEELQEIRNLTDFFIKHKNVEIFFIYGNKSNLTLQNNFTEEINFTVNGNPPVNTIFRGKSASLSNVDVSNITLISPINKFFNITENKNFYSVLRVVKENETYYC